MSGASDVRRRSALPHAAIAAAVIAAHAALLAYSAAVYSPVLDETGHLASGIDLWRTGEARAYCVNPPLVRSVAALPVVVAYPQLCRELPPRSTRHDLVGRRERREGEEATPGRARPGRDGSRT